MSGEPTVIYSAASTQQAHLLRGLLEERGITARVVNDAIQIAGGELPIGWTAAARVVVPAHDALAARELAEEFDQQSAHALPDEAPAEPDTLEDWREWPQCPQCGQRRSARCPVCGEVGSGFPLAESQESIDEGTVLLMCSSCDDSIRPSWYRLCPQCGYDYGSGVEVATSKMMNWKLDRATAVIVTLALVALTAFLGYFAWLFR